MPVVIVGAPAPVFADTSQGTPGAPSPTAGVMTVQGTSGMAPIHGVVGVTGPVSVTVGNLPPVQSITGAVGVVGPVAVTGTFDVQTVYATGVGVSGSVAVINFPESQGITGAVSISGPVAVTGTFNVQSEYATGVGVSGSVSVTNFPATQQVTGKVGITGPVGVTGAIAVNNFPAGFVSNQGTAAGVTGPWPIRLSDGSAFYDGTKTGQLPTGLSPSGSLKVALNEPMPTGMNLATRLVGASNIVMDLARGAAVPTGTRGYLVMGEDVEGFARAVDVRVDPLDGARRIQVEGRISITPPAPPPATTPFVMTFSGALSISSNQTDNLIITNGKNMVVQQIVAGCEGDTSERGSVVEVFYFDGTTEHLIERVYLNGFTTEVFPNTEKARDGTTINGNGTTRTLRVKRRRLSGSSQEVDFVVRGYEYTP